MQFVIVKKGRKGDWTKQTVIKRGFNKFEKWPYKDICRFVSGPFEIGKVCINPQYFYSSYDRLALPLMCHLCHMKQQQSQYGWTRPFSPLIYEI